MQYGLCVVLAKYDDKIVPGLNKIKKWANKYFYEIVSWIFMKQLYWTNINEVFIIFMKIFIDMMVWKIGKIGTF